MKLLYSTTSPYARKVLLLGRSLGLPLEPVAVNPLEDGDQLLAANPLAKVPALVLEDGSAVIDSPVIMEWLMDKAGEPRSGDGYFTGLQIMAVTDGILDAALSLVMEGRRDNAERSAYWQGRWQRAIDRALDHLEAFYADMLLGWSAQEIAVACTLDYLSFRLPDTHWRTGRPKLASWFEGAATRSDFRATDPRA